MNDVEMLSTYSKVADITEAMLSAAREGDWDNLIKLESRCAEHVRYLEKNDVNIELSPSSREKKIDFLKTILCYDKEIRNITQPRLAQLAALISNTGTQRKLNHAYNAGNLGG